MNSLNKAIIFGLLVSISGIMACSKDEAKVTPATPTPNPTNPTDTIHPTPRPNPNATLRLNAVDTVWRPHPDELLYTPPPRALIWEALYCVECYYAGTSGNRTTMDTIRVKQYYRDTLEYSGLKLAGGFQNSYYQNQGNRHSYGVTASQSSDSIHTYYRNYTASITTCKGIKSNVMFDVTDRFNEIDIALPDSVFWDSTAVFRNNTSSSFDYFVWEFAWNPYTFPSYTQHITTYGNASVSRDIRAYNLFPTPPSPLGARPFPFSVRAYRNGRFIRRNFSVMAYPR